MLSFAVLARFAETGVAVVLENSSIYFFGKKNHHVQCGLQKNSLSLPLPSCARGRCTARRLTATTARLHSQIESIENRQATRRLALRKKREELTVVSSAASSTSISSSSSSSAAAELFLVLFLELVRVDDPPRLLRLVWNKQLHRIRMRTF